MSRSLFVSLNSVTFHTGLLGIQPTTEALEQPRYANAKFLRNPLVAAPVGFPHGLGFLHKGFIFGLWPRLVSRLKRTDTSGRCGDKTDTLLNAVECGKLANVFNLAVFQIQKARTLISDAAKYFSVVFTKHARISDDKQVIAWANSIHHIIGLVNAKVPNVLFINTSISQLRRLIRNAFDTFNGPHNPNFKAICHLANNPQSNMEFWTVHRFINRSHA